MIDLGVQAQEAATRSQTLAAANQVVDTSRGETPHPAVSRTLANAPSRETSTVTDQSPNPPSAEKNERSGNKSETRDAQAEKLEAKAERRESRPEPSPAERAERLALLQSPARSIASAMRMPKHTGHVQCDHSGDVSVWHLIGHMAKGANQVSKYGFSGMNAGSVSAASKEAPRPGLMDGLRSGYTAGRSESPAAAVAAAALAADAEVGTRVQKPVSRRSRDGGMDR